MAKLNFYLTDPIDELAWPSRDDEISADSSALEIFTDFKQTKPLLIEPSTLAVDAERLMQKTHVRLKFVVDSNNHFLGIVSLEDINSQEQMKRVALGQVRDELTVADFMRPRHTLKAFDYADLAASTIDDVVHALQGSGQQHCLIIDREQHRIRGIVSASDIARKLHLPINIANESTFVSIFQAVHQ